jgi:hypothetical protein
MDGNIGARFLSRWSLALGPQRGRAWLAPAANSPTP